MESEKIILETDQYGQLKHPLHLSPNTRFEVTLSEISKQKPARRKPAKIAGKGKIVGNIMDPIAPAEDWDALK